MPIKKKRVVKPRVVRTRNANTQTESQFWGMIRATLRQKSRWWKPVSLCREKAKRKYTGPNKRQKFEYQCANCKKWYSGKDIAVDHIVPAGTLTCANDLSGFIDRLFCEVDGLQCLCTNCHDIKTKEDKVKLKQNRKWMKN